MSCCMELISTSSMRFSSRSGCLGLSLKSLSLSGYPSYSPCESSILPLISEYCQNLVTLNVKFAWLSVDNLNPMPMLTSLTLESARFSNKLLKEFNKCFPNLQVLNLVDVEGLVDPKIRLRNLKACHLSESSYYLSSLTLITPNLVTLKIECSMHATIHIEAPMLSHFHLVLDAFPHAGTFPVKNFENLKTLLLNSPYLYSLISEFSIMKTVENLTLGKEELLNDGDLRLTLAKVFMVFPNVSSLRVNSGAWSELEGWEILDGRKRLKRIRAYLRLVDQLLTLSYVACVLDQCDGLSGVSFLIHSDVGGSVSKSFMSRCTARWPGLKWRWGIWSDGNEDSWITDGTFN